MSLYVGLISGTSIDGIDAVLLQSESRGLTVLESLCYPIPAAMQAELREHCQNSALTPNSLQAADSAIADCHRRFGDLLAEATLALLARANCQASAVTAIGSHGQTIRHRPPSAEAAGFSLQIGAGERIAQHTGITAITDFRSADMAAGGQGAPLAPIFHAAIAPANEPHCAFLNLGGIGNLTLLDHGRVVAGYDTGPANTLMDAWVRQHRGLAYDAGGQWAASGQVNEHLLQQLLDDDFFRQPPPRSTGPEHFNLDWLASFAIADMAAEDVQATLLALTAESVASEVRRAELRPRTLYCCGGGAKNTALMQRLRELLPELQVHDTASLGLDPDYIEAALFAWLAEQHLADRALDLSAITGAEKPCVLGLRSEP